MILSVSTQTKLFLFSCLIGFILGSFFDIFRTLRKLFKHKNSYVQFEDLIFWIFSSIFSFFMILKKNNGLLRIYMILGIFLGFIIYINTVSQYFQKIFIVFIKLNAKIFKFILFPFAQIFKMIKAFFISTKKFFKSFLPLEKKSKRDENEQTT